MARILLDTNVLLRFVNPADNDYAVVRSAVRALRSSGAELFFAPQNLVEFWNVCARPAEKNGLGLSIDQTRERAELIESKLLLLRESECVHSEWRRLVVAYGVAGVQVHDARLVAAMMSNGVSQLLTFNDRDSQRYQEIETLHPREVVAAM